MDSALVLSNVYANAFRIHYSMHGSRCRKPVSGKFAQGISETQPPHKHVRPNYPNLRDQLAVLGSRCDVVGFLCPVKDLDAAKETSLPRSRTFGHEDGTKIFPRTAKSGPR